MWMSLQANGEEISQVARTMVSNTGFTSCHKRAASGRAAPQVRMVALPPALPPVLLNPNGLKSGRFISLRFSGPTVADAPRIQAGLKPAGLTGRRHPCYKHRQWSA